MAQSVVVTSSAAAIAAPCASLVRMMLPPVLFVLVWEQYSPQRHAWQLNLRAITALRCASADRDRAAIKAAAPLQRSLICRIEGGSRWHRISAPGCGDYSSWHQAGRAPSRSRQAAFERAAARQLDAHRIDEAAVDLDLIMHVGAGRMPGRPMKPITWPCRTRLPVPAPWRRPTCGRRRSRSRYCA